MLGWSLAQGLCLVLLHQWIESLAHPGRYFALIWSLYVIAVLLPLTMQLLAEYCHDRKLWIMASALILLMAFGAAYLGHSSWAEGLPDYYISGEMFKFGFMAITCWFVVLPFVEHRLRLGNWFGDYGLLFWLACGNNVRLMSAGIFSAVFWALLGLWAALFKVLKIDFFVDLFTHRTFVYPVSCLAMGVGLSLYASRREMLLSHYRNFLNLLAWLLPLVASILLLFLAALPFKGLGSLWQTGYATALMLGLAGLTILLFNAYWQDGIDGEKFAKWLLWPIEAALLAMPVLIVLSAYAMSLRIAQYGWTKDRVWAVLLIVLMGIYAFGYAGVVMNRRCGHWLSAARNVNISGAVVLVFMLLLMATPILDPARIAVNSQMNRLLKSSTTIPDFDFQYLRFEGGKYGDRALKDLMKLTGHPQAETIRRNAEAAFKSEWRTYGGEQGVVLLSRQELMKHLLVFPKNASIDLDFYDYLASDSNVSSNYRAYRYCLQNKQACFLLSVDLNGDGQEEIVIMDQYGSQNGVFSFKDKTWKYIGYLRSEPPYHNNGELKKNLEASDLAAVEPEWRILRLGKQRYSIEPQE